MKHLRRFEEFVKKREVKKQAPDTHRAKSLFEEAKEKLHFFETLKKKMKFSELSPNYVVETCYDIIIELVRSNMIRVGYKSQSHEAEVSYLKNLGFSETEVRFMNQLRYFRNGIKYYGKKFDLEYARKVDEFLYKALKKLL